MGTWISHLRIAENLLDELPGLDAAAFTFGNLAPDSGIPNEDWTAFDPPKEVTHFLGPGEDEGRCADYHFYQAYVAGRSAEADRWGYSFALGFFFHLVSDNIWARRIGGPTKQLNAALFAEDKGTAWSLVKRDWYDLDARYLREHPQHLYWRVFVVTPNPVAPLPFLNDAGLQHSFGYIRMMYPERLNGELDRRYPYLNEATMNRYVDDSTRALLNIYRRLQKSPDLGDSYTTLALLDAAETEPYVPLGDDG